MSGFCVETSPCMYCVQERACLVGLGPRLEWGRLPSQARLGALVKPQPRIIGKNMVLRRVLTSASYSAWVSKLGGALKSACFPGEIIPKRVPSSAVVWKLWRLIRTNEQTDDQKLALCSTSCLHNACYVSHCVCFWLLNHNN